VLVGDVAYEDVSLVAGAITPLPRGVGPMKIACLLPNTATSAYRYAAFPWPEWMVAGRLARMPQRVLESPVSA